MRRVGGSQCRFGIPPAAVCSLAHVVLQMGRSQSGWGAHRPGSTAGTPVVGTCNGCPPLSRAIQQLLEGGC